MTINNNNIFGAFTLGEVRSGRLTGDWLNKEFVANYGWWGAGFIPLNPSTATVDRIDFSNDSVSASTRGSLSLARNKLAATGNSNYGWFGGGDTPGTFSTVDRIDFSNDSPTASVRGPLSLTRNNLRATGNSNYGWFGGGVNPTPATVSTVDRIDFSNDSGTASVRGSLSIVKDRSSATGNSNYGWFAGSAPSTISTVDRIDFSNDYAIASVRGPMSAGRYTTAATGNSNYGWWGGGWDQSIVNYSPKVDRVDFSNDLSTSSLRGSLTAARGNFSATGNSNYGWFGGGTPTPGSIVATVDRIDFSNDTTTASPRGALSAARGYQGSASGVLNIRRQKAGSYGWFGGGAPAPGAFSIVDRIDFSNDLATASTKGPLSSARYAFTSTGNSNYGWFAGGAIPSAPTATPVATVDRIDFSNDSTSASARGSLPLAKRAFTATGNSNYGWFGGGLNPTVPASYSIVDRINFSNDSAAATPRGLLSAVRYSLAATGNSNYGWFGGGTNPGATPTTIATVEQKDFSNDTSVSIRGSLTLARSSLVATGNSNYGWFAGGSQLPGATVDRIDFSNDSISTSVRGPLFTGRNALAATGNSNYGWFGGGVVTPTPAIVSTVDRINFSNDSVTASVRGSLNAPAGRFNLAATSNTTR